MSKSAPEPRLLTRAQAAAYCGMSLPTFERLCPVDPVDLRMRGYLDDRKVLDRWIDGLSGPRSQEDEDWLGKLFGHDGHCNARTGN
jgi:hypothetical protein